MVEVLVWSKSDDIVVALVGLQVWSLVTVSPRSSVNSTPAKVSEKAGLNFVVVKLASVRVIEVFVVIPVGSGGSWSVVFWSGLGVLSVS